jgi:hypothetical protein
VLSFYSCGENVCALGSPFSLLAGCNKNTKNFLTVWVSDIQFSLPKGKRNACSFLKKGIHAL